MSFPVCILLGRCHVLSDGAEPGGRSIERHADRYRGNFPRPAVVFARLGDQKKSQMRGRVELQIQRIRRVPNANDGKTQRADDRAAYVGQPFFVTATRRLEIQTPANPRSSITSVGGPGTADAGMLALNPAT